MLREIVTYLATSATISVSSTISTTAAGLGNRPVQFAQPQKIAVVELSRPAIVPIVRGL